MAKPSQHGAPAFLGRGWAFPPKFTRAEDEGGTVAMVEGDADIQESLCILLTTRLGERIMRPGYGSGVWSHVMGDMSATSRADLASQIEDAILHWEPRIRVETIDFEIASANDGILMISITYRIPAINSRSNIVFPFYLEEGTNVRGVDARALPPR